MSDPADTPAPIPEPAPAAAAPPPARSFLVQKFAKLSLNNLTVIGYSVAGEETVCQIPELNVCFDIGRAPYFALTSDFLCISHGHMDHLAGIAYYLSQRFFQGMKPGTILLPRDLVPGVDQMLRCWRGIERQQTPYKLVGLAPGESFAVRKDFLIRAVETHHGGSSLGYALVSVREKLKPEYLGRPGPELVALRKAGTPIQYRTEVPLVTFLGDTSFGPVFDQPDVANAEILITECTFYEADHKARAKHGRHLHVDTFVEKVVPKLKNKYVVVSHVSRRTGVRRAKRTLSRRLGAEEMKRFLFLMDLENAADAGDMEDLGPKPDNDAGE
ncbi:MAG TPA: MBL fold metallo-hydrolase [Tepidisphaeraceae bacterium]|nr:MBL fold metallo-hydrolase [Tepidisphaeraceae bacterium]